MTSKQPEELKVGCVFIERQPWITLSTTIVDTVLFISKKNISIMRMIIPHDVDALSMIVYDLNKASIIKDAMNGTYWSSKHWIQIR